MPEQAVLPFAQKNGDNVYRRLAMYPHGKVIDVGKEFVGKQTIGNDLINPTDPHGGNQTISYIKRKLTTKVF